MLNRRQGHTLFDIVSRHRVPPVHLGKILCDKFLTPKEIGVYELAKLINVPRSRVNDVMVGRPAVTTSTALRPGLYFGSTPEFWINLQGRYDLNVADCSLP